MILAHLANFAHVPAHAMYLQDSGGGGVSFSAAGLLQNMGWPARIIALILFIMSIWSLAVMIDRWLYFNAARKQSREFAPKVAGALKDGRLDEAIKLGDRSKKSHLAEVVTAGLQEFRSFGSGGNITEEQVESSQRALERSEAIVHAKLKRGLGGLATIGSTAPFIGLLGTVIGILNAFQAIATQKTSGIGAVAGGISEALVTTAFGLFVAIPAVMIVQLLHPTRWKRSTLRWTTYFQRSWWTTSSSRATSKQGSCRKRQGKHSRITRNRMAFGGRPANPVLRRHSHCMVIRR